MDDVYYSKSSIEEAFKKFSLNWNSFIENTINSIKPSDVRPVVSGKWIDTMRGWECSHCHVEQEYTKWFDYCPFCGAKLISK